MATTSNTITATAGQTEFSFSFPYLKKESIKVTIDTVATTAFTIPDNNPTTVVLNSGATAGQVIVISRVTSTTATPATFFSGGAIRSQDLNDNFDSLLYINQEKENQLTEVIAGGIADGSITSSKLADQSVGTAALIDGGVATVDLADNAVTTTKIADNAVTTAKIVDSAVTPTKLDRSYLETAGDTMTGPLVGESIQGNPNLDLSSGSAQVARAVGSALIFTDDPNQGVTGIATGDSPNDAGFVTKGALRLQNTDGPGVILSKKIGSIAAAPGSTYVSFVRSGQPGSSGSIGHPSNNPAQISYNTTSDYRLKENVSPLTGASDRLKQLKPSTFTFISDPGKNLVEGFIAHEVQEVIPGAVTGEKDYVDNEGVAHYQGVDLGKIVPLLTSSLQEALTRIESLEAKVQTLENN